MRDELLGPMLVGLVYFRLRQCWILLALAVPAGAQMPRDPSPPSAYPKGSETASRDSDSAWPHRPLTAFFRGRQLPYIVIDGMAVPRRGHCAWPGRRPGTTTASGRNS